MEQPLTPTLLLFAAYVWVLLLGGLVALVFDLRADAKSRTMQLPTWNVSWLDFGIYAWSLIMLTIAAQGMVGFLLERSGVSPDDISLYVLAQGGVFHSVVLALVFFAYRRPQLRQALVPSPVRLRGSGLARLILRFFFVGIFLAMLVGKGWDTVLNLLAAAGQMQPPAPQELVELFIGAGIDWRTAALVFLAVVVAPVSEEFLFRVGLYRFLKGRFSPRFALIVSSAVFALMHFNVLSFLPLFLIGMLLCRSYERSGNVLVPIGFHALFNANNIALLVLMGPQVAP